LSKLFKHLTAFLGGSVAKPLLHLLKVRRLLALFNWLRRTAAALRTSGTYSRGRTASGPAAFAAFASAFAKELERIRLDGLRSSRGIQRNLIALNSFDRGIANLFTGRYIVKLVRFSFQDEGLCSPPV
jgi:hypothetical protein